jgi:hypothetical protein
VQQVRFFLNGDVNRFWSLAGSHLSHHQLKGAVGKFNPYVIVADPVSSLGLIRPFLAGDYV